MHWLTISLAICLAALTLAKEDPFPFPGAFKTKPAPLPTIELQNWLEINPDSWPSAEVSATSDDLFYLYHTEIRANTFGLNKTALNWTDVSGTAELTFKYWANHDLAHLRAYPNTTGSRFDFLLDHAKQWTKVSMFLESEQLWNNLSLVGGDGFYTIAFKEVQVRYSTAHSQQNHTINCLPPGCSNIFRPRLLTSQQYSSPNTPHRHFVPVQFPPYNPSHQYISLDLSPIDSIQRTIHDYCLTFNFTTPDQTLLIDADINRPYHIEYTSTESPLGRICTSWLDGGAVPVDRMYFSFGGQPQRGSIDDYSMVLVNASFEAAINPLRWGTRNEEDEQIPWEMYFMKSPEGFNLSKKGEIVFTLPNLQELKAHHRHPVYHTQLQTRWVESIPASSSHANTFLLRLTPSGDYQASFVTINGRINSPQSVLAEVNLGRAFPEPGQSHLESIPTRPLLGPFDWYQLTLHYYIDLQKAPANQTEVTIKFADISINDPCIDGLHGFESVQDCSNHGICRATYFNFSYYCRCSVGYTGSTCQMVDYCARNLAICTAQGLHCLNRPEKKSFECACKHVGEVWDGKTLRCVKKNV